MSLINKLAALYLESQNWAGRDLKDFIPPSTMDRDIALKDLSKNSRSETFFSLFPLILENLSWEWVLEETNCFPRHPQGGIFVLEISKL